MSDAEPKAEAKRSADAKIKAITGEVPKNTFSDRLHKEMADHYESRMLGGSKPKS